MSHLRGVHEALLCADALARVIDGMPFSHRLFHVLDIDNSGHIDLQEFVGGLSLLCKGTADEKLERKPRNEKYLKREN
jgi:hypothetical protein